MANPILVTGAAGRVGAIGRSVTELLLKQGNAVRAMVRSEDERAQALRDMGAEVVAGNLLDLDSMHKVIAGCEAMYFGMSLSDAYLAATVNVAAVAKHHGVKGLVLSSILCKRLSRGRDNRPFGCLSLRRFPQSSFAHAFLAALAGASPCEAIGRALRAERRAGQPKIAASLPAPISTSR